MAKQQDPKKKAEEIKNSFDDVTLSIKDLEKELSKVFNTKKLDNFVKSLTAGFEDSIDYSDKIQDKMTDMSKSVTSLSKEFGSLRGELNSFSKDISNIKIPNLNIISNINEVDISSLQESIKNLPDINLNASISNVDTSKLENIDLPKLDDINANIKFNVQPVELPTVDDIQANIKFNTEAIDIPTIDDINASIKYNVQAFELPKVDNINASINYITQVPAAPKVDDIQANIKYNTQPVELPDVQDIQANIKFNTRSIEIPEVNDINASIKYDVQSPELPKIENINAGINYTNQVPDAPKVEDIQANIKFNVQPIDLPKVEDIESSIKYNVNDIKLPEIKDIESAIKFNVQDLELPNFNDITLNAKLNKIDLSELDKMPISELIAEIGLVDTSLLDKTINKYNPIILSSIIDTPDVSNLNNIAKNAPSIQLQTEINTSNATAAIQDQANATNEVTANTIGTTKALDKVQKKYDNIVKKVNEGGKVSKSELKFLTDFNKTLTGTIQESTKAQKEFQNSIKDSTAGQKKFADISKELALYDGPRFKASGLVTKEMADQISKSKFLEDSKSRLFELDGRATIYSEILNADTSKLVDITDKLVKGQERSVNIVQDINNSSAELIEAKRLENKLDERLYDNLSKQAELEEKLNTATGEDRNKLLDNLISLQEESDKLTERANSAAENRLLKETKLNSLIQEQKSLTESLPELQKEQNTLTTAAAIQATGLVTTYELLNNITKDQITDQGTLATKMAAVEKSAYNVGTAQYSQIDLTDEINEKLELQRDLDQARANILNKQNELLPEQFNEAMSIVNANIQANNAQLATYKALQKTSEGYNTVQEKAESLRDSMMAPIDKLFGIVPSGLSKMLGLDKIQTELKDKLFKSISDGFMGASGGVSGFFSAASAGASTLMTSLLPILPLLLTIAGVVGLVKLFMDADKQVSQLATDLNVSYQESLKLNNMSSDLEVTLAGTGVTLADINKQMVDLQNATGMNIGKMALTNEKAKGLLETSTMLTKQYGLSADETMGLNQAAAIAGTTLEKISLQAEALGEDGLVPAQEIMKDIAKTSKSTLMNFSKNPKALALAVKQARLMGVTLDQVAAAGDRLMDVESSVTAENKARLILGRDINMNAARYYAMTGQTEKQMEEMKKQAGSLAAYDKMGPIQKRALADALGMSNDELAGMMAKEKELQTMGIDEKKLNEILTKDKEGQLDLETTLKGLKDEGARKALKAKIEEQRRAGIQEKLGQTLQKVTDLLYKLVDPLLEPISQFVDSLGDGEGILKSLKTVFSGIGSILGVIVQVSMAILKGAWMPIKFTIDLISGAFDKISKLVKYIKTDIFGIKDATGEAGKAAEDTGMSMEVIKGIATTIGVIIGGWFLLKGLSKAKDGLSSMYDSAKGIGSSLKEGFKSIKEGKFPSLGKKKGAVEELSDKKIETPEVDTKGADKTLKNTKSFADRLNSMFKSINDTLKAIFKGIGDMLKNIFKFIKDTVKSVLDVIKTVMKDIFKTIKDVAKELTSTLQSLLQNIGDILNSAIDVIKDVGTNLIGAVGDLLGAVIEVIDSQGTALVEALGNIGNALGEQVMKIVNTILEGLGEAASKLPNIMGSIGDAIASFFQSLGKISFSEILKGALVMGILAGTLFLLGKALGTFADVSWEDIGKAAVAMIGLGAAMAILGAAIEFIVPGAVALAVMAGALYLFGKALQEVAEGADGASKLLTAVFEGLSSVIESIGNAISTVITSIATSIATLGTVDAANLLAVGGALVVLGAGLLALTAGEVVNGLASFFGASPVDTLKELETIDGNKMKVTAEGLKTMSDALTNFGNVNTDPIVKSADALDQFNNQVIKGGLADALNSFLGSDPFAVFTQLAAIDTAKIDTVAKSIALAGTSIETFNEKMGSLDDSIGDKGDLIASLLNDIADVEHSEIDALATAIDNLSKSYDSLLASMKNITDDDIMRMQQIASATPKEVGGGGITDVISDTLGSAMSGVKDLASNAISSVGSFFGFGDEETPKQETQITQTKPTTVTPVMQQTAEVRTQPIVQTEQAIDTDNTQPNFKNVEALLKELITKVDQPVVLKIGEKAISDMQSVMSLKKSYSSNVNGYRA